MRQKKNSQGGDEEAHRDGLRSTRRQYLAEGKTQGVRGSAWRRQYCQAASYGGDLLVAEQMTERNLQDPYQLERFVEAQDGIYETALSELRRGRKRSHWMWFIFPQIDGLARSSTAAYYAIKSLDEAKAYLEHPILGSRLEECSRTLLGLERLSTSDIFGYPDDLKFCSSMTLFDRAASQNNLFAKAIIKYCAGQRDQKTLAILNAKTTDWATW